MRENLDYESFHSFSLVTRLFPIEETLLSICHEQNWEMLAQKRRVISKEGCSPLTTSESLNHKVNIRGMDEEISLIYEELDGSIVIKSMGATVFIFKILSEVVHKVDLIAFYGIEKDGNRVDLLMG